MNLPYEIISFVSKEVILDETEQKQIYQSEKYNPTLQLNFTLLDQIGQNLSDRFILFDLHKREPIIRDTIITRRVNDIQIGVFYKCLDNNIDCKVDKKDESVYYILL